MALEARCFSHMSPSRESMSSHVSEEAKNTHAACGLETFFTVQPVDKILVVFL